MCRSTCVRHSTAHKQPATSTIPPPVTKAGKGACVGVSPCLGHIQKRQGHKMKEAQMTPKGESSSGVPPDSPTPPEPATPLPSPSAATHPHAWQRPRVCSACAGAWLRWWETPITPVGENSTCALLFQCTHTMGNHSPPTPQASPSESLRRLLTKANHVWGREVGRSGRQGKAKQKAEHPSPCCRWASPRGVISRDPACPCRL